ncbi:MAG: glycosyltransferase [Patescibacteria group bacterium]
MQQKPKLLYIVTQGGPWGGAQKYVFDLAYALKDTFDVTIAVGEPRGQNDLQKKAKDFGINVRQLTHLVRPFSPLHDLLTIFELNRLYGELKPNIVHLNSSKASILGSLAGQMSNVKCQMSIIYTVHGWVFDEPLSWVKKNFYRLAEKITAKQKDKIIVLSKLDQDTATNLLSIEQEKIPLIPHGLPPLTLIEKQTARSIIKKNYKFSISDNALWVGTIANFYPTKGLDILISAISECKKDIPNMQFLIFGDGPERQNLESGIWNLELNDRIHLVGFVPEAAQFLSAFDLFVLPSRKEGFPYAILEARVAGLPIIAAAVGGVTSLLENYPTATLVPPNDVQALSQALRNFHTTAPLPSSRLPTPTYEDMVAKTRHLYQTLLKA